MPSRLFTLAQLIEAHPDQTRRELEESITTPVCARPQIRRQRFRALLVPGWPLSGAGLAQRGWKKISWAIRIDATNYDAEDSVLASKFAEAPNLVIYPARFDGGRRTQDDQIAGLIQSALNLRRQFGRGGEVRTIQKHRRHSLGKAFGTGQGAEGAR
jgi:hypothetical protein